MVLVLLLWVTSWMKLHLNTRVQKMKYHLERFYLSLSQIALGVPEIGNQPMELRLNGMIFKTLLKT